MTAPTAGAFTPFPHGPGQPQDNLTNLPNRGARGLGVIGTEGVDLKDIKIGNVVILTGTMAQLTGTASLYLATSEDGIHWTDGLDPNSNDAAAEALKFSTGQSVSSMLVQRINCTANNSQFMFMGFSVLMKLFYVPTFVSLYVLNAANGAFGTDNTKFLAGYRLITFN